MLLFAYLILYFLLVFVLRSVLLWKKTGINPFTFEKTDDAHDYNGKVFTFITVLELIVVGIYAFKEEWYEYLLPFWYLENQTLQKIGWVLLLVSLILVWFSQSQMANSWRIGIDENNKTKLVTKGIFSISRNPITLLIISLSTLSVNTQIRLEEKFLKREFGKEYIEYAEKVRRWI